MGYGIEVYIFITWHQVKGALLFCLSMPEDNRRQIKTLKLWKVIILLLVTLHSLRISEVMAVMVVCSLSTHLGLSQAIGEIVMKVASCHKCLTFWLCLGILLIVGYNIIIAATAAILSSYLSNYFMLLLMLLGKKYDKLWKRIRKRN